MFIYTAKTNGEGMVYNLSPGYYKATIHEAQESRSKAGNDVMKLTLWVEGPEGYVSIRETLVFMDSMYWKVDQFIKATGRDVEPGKEIIVDAAQLIGRTLWVKTTEEESVSEKDGKTYINPRVDKYLREDKVPYAGPIRPIQQPAPMQPATTTAPQQNAGTFGWDGKGNYMKGATASTMKPAPMPNEEDDDIPFKP